MLLVLFVEEKVGFLSPLIFVDSSHSLTSEPSKKVSVEVCAEAEGGKSILCTHVLGGAAMLFATLLCRGVVGGEESNHHPRFCQGRAKTPWISGLLRGV